MTLENLTPDAAGEPSWMEADPARSPRRYFDLFETAPVGYAVLDEAGFILEANLTAARMVGAERNALVGKRFSDFVVEGDLDVYRMHRRALREFGPLHSCELRLVRGVGGTSDDAVSDYFWTHIDEHSPRFTEGAPVQTWLTFTDITARISAEEDLWGGETRFADLFENAPVAYHELDEDGRILAVNSKWLQLLGYEREEVISRSFFEFWSEGAGEAFSKWIEALDAGDSGPSEIQLVRKNGETVTVARTARTGRAADGRRTTRCVFVDITESKRAELCLRESEERFAKVFRGNPVATAVIHFSDGLFLDVNQAFLDLFGYEYQEVVGRTTLDIDLWVSAQDMDSFGQELLERRHATIGPSMQRAKSGEVRLIRMTAEMVELAGEECAITMAYDITAQTTAEAALRASEEMYRAAIETSADGFYLTDMEGHLLEVNEQYCQMSGFSREEILGMRIMDLEAKESPEETAAHIAAISRDGSVIFETLHRRKDGTIWQVEATTSYWGIGGGRLFVFMRDVAKRRRAEFLVRTRGELAVLEAQVAPDELLRVALDKAELLTGSSLGFFYLLDDDQESVTLQAWSSNALLVCSATGRRAPYTLGVGSGLASLVESRCPAIHNDCARPNATRLPEGHPPVSSALFFPVVRADKVVAVMAVGNKPSEYTDEDVDAVRELASMAADVVSNMKKQEEFKHFFELVPDMVCIATSDGYFHRLNSAWGATLGYSDGELKSVPFIEFVHPDDREQTAEQLARQVGQGLTVKAFTNRYRAKNGSYRWFEWNAAAMSDGLIFAATRDVTERVEAGRALADSEERFRMIFERSRMGITLADTSFKLIGANPAFCDMIGYTPEELSTLTFAEITPEDRREIDRANVLKMAAGELDQYRTEKQYVRKDGSRLWASLLTTPIRDSQDETAFYLALVDDISDRKASDERLMHYQSRLQSLAAELAVSEERERGRLGIELHDGIGQVLSAAKMVAQSLASERLEPSAAEQAQRLVELLGESIKEVRALTAELAPTVLFELGLQSALFWLRDRYMRLYGLRCAIRVDKEASDLTGRSTILIFRIVREALNNVVRHSHAEAAVVTVRKNEASTSVSIRDRGTGFDPSLVDEPHETGGFGLFSIREECLGMGGSMEVWSEPGRGTRISASIPEREDDRAAPAVTH